MRILLATVAAVVLAGCASQPSSTPATSASTAALAAPAAETTAAVTAPAASAAPAKTASTKSYGGGYKKRQKDGVTVYCKKIAKIGSRFEEETCLTEAEMEQMAQQAESDRQQFRRNQTLCGTGGCGGQ